MKEVTISVSFFAEGRVVTSSYKAKVDDIDLLFKNAITDAQLFAGARNGEAVISRSANSLHIQYHNTHCDIINRVFLVSTLHPKRFILIDEQLNPQYV